MKIAITCYPTYGGSGVVATELGKALSKRNHQIHFITYDQPFRLTDFSENISYHEVSVNDYPLFKYPPYSIALASKMTDVIIREKIDVLHVHYAIPHAISAFLAKCFLKERGYKPIPIITTLHGTDITLIGTDPTLADAVRFGINQSDVTTAVSKYLKKETEEVFSPKKPVEVIYNFVDTNFFNREDCISCRASFAKPDEKILIHVSNFREIKRVPDVISTFYNVQQKIPSILLLLGDGPVRSSVEQQCRELNILNKVRFLGKQTNIVPLLSIADVMIMPSVYESFGLAALEALSCGVPVIATNAGGFSELIQHEKNGFLCEVKNVEMMSSYAMKLLSDSDMLQQFRINSRKRSEDFAVEKIIKEYENLYKRVITDASY